MTDKRCWFSENHLYLNKNHNGFLLAPCCLAVHHIPSENYVSSIDKVYDSKFLSDIRNDLRNNKKPVSCKDCWVKESEENLFSLRQNFLNHLRLADQKNINDSNQKIESWDLRPGNTCNLKCIMCSPFNSTSWYTDIDIYEKYMHKFKSENVSSFSDDEWDYIKENTANRAKKIYIAGGEPFYMKQTVDLLYHLSKYKWNLENTEITINTNGVSFNEKLNNILLKFKKLVIIISIDGYNEVNEYIRYPTVFSELLSNIEYFSENFHGSLNFNTTVQACNLPNLNYMALQLHKIQKKYNKKFYFGLHPLIHPSFLGISSLKPNVIEEVIKDFDNGKVVDDIISTKYVKQLVKEYYHYNDDHNKKLKQYLNSIDGRRNLNSRKTLPWCWI